MASKPPRVEAPGDDSVVFEGSIRGSIVAVTMRIERREPVDALVIGGGVTGCAVARDAAARGLTVLLAESVDLAFGTSGRSTKLLHGGLRYLEHGHLGLVREALRERETTARLAPQLALPLRLIAPVRRGSRPGPWTTRLGVALYDVLAGRHPLPRGTWVGPGELADLAPGLAPGFGGGVAFSDRQTDDARLTVAIAKDAARRGARIRVGLAVVSIEPAKDGFLVGCRAESGGPEAIAARAVVNASGAWGDRIDASASSGAPRLRASRGAHLVLDRLPLSCALLLSGERRGHRLFAIPWRGLTLFGTTDVEDHGDPGREVPEADDLVLLFHEARRMFPAVRLTRRDVVWAFTGVRPLVPSRGDTLSSSREHRIEDDRGLIRVVGGKLTTWRLMGEQVVDALVSRLGRGGRSPETLLVDRLPEEPQGTYAERTEVAVREEFARHADDVVFRRLPIGHDPRRVRAALPEIVDGMARHFSWSAETRKSEESRVLAHLESVERALDLALGAAEPARQE
jgi:glycerol-3-phosphate dehydrogenase